MNENHWDRREFDKKTRHEFLRQLDDIREEMRKGLDRLGAEVDTLNEYLRGGPNNQDPLGTRVHLVETGLTELKVIVKGDALGRGSLIELTKQAVKDSEDAKKIAEGKVEVQVAKRGQLFTLLAGIAAASAMATSALIANWDKIFGDPETPIEWAERLRRETQTLQKTRGRELKSKLREIERAARGR